MTDTLSRKGWRVLFLDLAVVGLIFVGFGGYALAGNPTIIGGKITEDMVLTLDKSPYRITKNLEVPIDIKLTIKAGVEIKVDLYTAIVVKGNLHALGTKDKWIKITSTKPDEKWDGIQLKDDSFDYSSDELIEGHGVLVEYCQISLARTGITTEKCNPLIRKNKFKNNDDGIMCRDYSNPLIENNVFLNNTIAIECVNFSSPDVRHNTIVGLEGKGIRCENYSSPKITYNTIFGKGTTWWKGLTVVTSSQPVINFNNIYANGGYNLMMVKLKTEDKSPSVNAENNWWGISDLESITKKIQDKHDKADLGEVDFDPFSESKIANAKHNY
jgi:parallel beta-helix repeat protein